MRYVRLRITDGMCGVWNFFVLSALLGAAIRVRSSEFPERECCDLPPPGALTTPSSAVQPGSLGTSVRPGKEPNQHNCYPKPLLDLGISRRTFMKCSLEFCVSRKI